MSELIMESVCSTIIIGNESKNINNNSNQQEKVNLKFSKEEIQEQKRSSPLPKTNKIDSNANFIQSNNINLFNSCATTQTTNLFKVLNTFFNKIQEIINPKNAKKYDFLEDYFEENERIKVIDSIVNDIKNLKDRLDELSKVKEKKDSETNTDIDLISKNYQETIKEMANNHQKDIEIFSKIKDELFLQIKNYQNENNNLKNIINEHIQKNINSPKIIKNNDTLFETGIYFNKNIARELKIQKLIAISKEKDSFPNIFKNKDKRNKTYNSEKSILLNRLYSKRNTKNNNLFKKGKSYNIKIIENIPNVSKGNNLLSPNNVIINFK